MLASNPVHSIGPKQNLLFKVIFGVVYFVLEVSHAELCSLPHLTCSSALIILPLTQFSQGSLLVGKLLVSREKISLCCSILSTLHLLLPSGDVKDLSFSNICVKITGF